MAPDIIVCWKASA